MDPLMVGFSPLLCSGAFAALTTYAWVQRNEPESIMQFVLLVSVASSLPIAFFPSSMATYAVWQPYLLFVTVFIVSVIVYRLSPLHPLSSYPGPLPCKVSKLWMAYISFRGKQHDYFKELHRQYGPIVRVGPNELSVTEKEFIHSILGRDGLPKGPLWKGRIITPASQKHKKQSLISAPDLRSHSQLRKPWNKAFGTAPMLDYMDLVTNKASELNEHLSNLCNLSSDKKAKIDMAHWISFFSFDFMGEMAFGYDFGLMRHGDKDGMWSRMESALLLPAVTQHIPWAAPFLQRIALFGKTNEFTSFAARQAKIRVAQEAKKKDLFYHLLQAADPESIADPFPMIVSNAVLAIIAGSDTTATALSNIIFYLLEQPKYFKALRSEIEANFPLNEHAPIKDDKLCGMKMLNAVINEALRLLPPLPIMLQRAAPKGSGGKLVGKHFIPEGTAIVLPPYCLHRDPRYFSPHTDKFWPERWLREKGSDDPNFVHDLTAFIPFSSGPANCAGKPLAVFELRYVTAMLVRNFDMSFQEDFDPRTWEANLLDRFVFTKGPLSIKLAPRAI